MTDNKNTILLSKTPRHRRVSSSRCVLDQRRSGVSYLKVDGTLVTRSDIGLQNYLCMTLKRHTSDLEKSTYLLGSEAAHKFA